MSVFTIGQKVMCVKPRYSGAGRFNTPKFMQIYTVRAHCAASDTPAILLKEIHNKEVKFARTLKRGEASFAEWHFNPLEQIEDEIVTRIPQATWRLLNCGVEIK